MLQPEKAVSAISNKFLHDRQWNFRRKSEIFREHTEWTMNEWGSPAWFTIIGCEAENCNWVGPVNHRQLELKQSGVTPVLQSSAGLSSPGIHFHWLRSNDEESRPIDWSEEFIWRSTISDLVRYSTDAIGINISFLMVCAFLTTGTSACSSSLGMLRTLVGGMRLFVGSTLDLTPRP